jgi:hypothetical protein
VELSEAVELAQGAMDQVMGQRVVARAAQVQELLELATRLVSYGEFAEAAAWTRQAERELSSLHEYAEIWRAGR